MTTWKVTNRATGETIHAYTADEPYPFEGMGFDVCNHIAEVVQVDEVLEVAQQGPIGPPGPAGATGPAGEAATNYPGKTLIWSQGKLAEVRLYSDAAKTQLSERRVMAYTGDALTSISFYDGDGALTKTRTMGYSSGVLTGVTEA